MVAMAEMIFGAIASLLMVALVVMVLCRVLAFVLAPIVFAFHLVRAAAWLMVGAVAWAIKMMRRDVRGRAEEVPGSEAAERRGEPGWTPHVVAGVKAEH